MRVLVTGGGSGGHVSPALATIQKLKEKISDLEVLYLGGRLGMEGSRGRSIEQKIFPSTNIPHKFIHAGKLQRRFNLSTPFLLLGVIPGFFEAFYFILSFKPDVVFSTGGFVTVPVVFAAWLLRVPILIHEQTAVVGLANKVCSFFSKRIAVSFPSSVHEFPLQKTFVSGNPLRKQVMEAGKKREQERERKIPFTLYITGGALGSHIINEAVEEILPELLTKFRVIHQCGESEIFKDYDRLSERKKYLDAQLRARYEVVKYVDTDHIEEVFAQADLAIARAGANTVNELAFLGIPAIFVPIPWVTHNEQYKNARILVNAGSAMILPEDQITGEKLLNQIREILKNFTYFQNKADEAKKLIRIDAAEVLAEEIIRIAKLKNSKLKATS